MNLTDIFISPFKLVASRTFMDPVPTLRVSLKNQNCFRQDYERRSIYFM